MNHFILDILLCVVAYGILVYFMSIFLRRNKKNTGNQGGNDGGDGGVNIDDTPELDLPPGVTLPDGRGPGVPTSPSPKPKEEIEL